MAGKGKARPYCDCLITIGGQIAARPKGKNGATPKKVKRKQWYVGPPFNKHCGSGHGAGCIHGTAYGEP